MDTCFWSLFSYKQHMLACTLTWPSLVLVNNLMQFLMFPHVKVLDIITKTDQFINCCICVTTLFSFCAFLFMSFYFICTLMQLCIIWLEMFNHIPIISIIIIIIIIFVIVIVICNIYFSSTTIINSWSITLSYLLFNADGHFNWTALMYLVADSVVFKFVFNPSVLSASHPGLDKYDHSLYQ